MVSVLGFPVLGWGSSAIGTYKIPGSSVSLSMLKEIAPLLVGVARDFNAQVEPLRAGTCWGFNPKHIEGSSVWSNHAWGGAIDLNANTHPMGSKNTFSAAKQAKIHAILARYTYKGTRLIRWGGDYTGRHDDMHFEINVTRAVALAAVDAMSTSATVVAGSRTIKRGDKGADVKVLQSKMAIVADGLFGPVTESKLKAWQKSHGLTVDGVCGPKTWAALGFK